MEGDGRKWEAMGGRGREAHLRSTPPSREALRHSGGERRLSTSATVTLYLEVEERRERRPGTEQNMSVGRADISRFSFISRSRGRWARPKVSPWLAPEERDWGRESWESREARWMPSSRLPASSRRTSS
jgi:hypothetical protein